MADTEAAKRSLSDIEARHADIVRLEKSIEELRDLFMAVSLMVDQQVSLVPLSWLLSNVMVLGFLPLSPSLYGVVSIHHLITWQQCNVIRSGPISSKSSFCLPSQDPPSIS